MSDDEPISIVERLRGAAAYAREFGIPQSADIHDCAADEIEQLRERLAVAEASIRRQQRWRAS